MKFLYAVNFTQAHKTIAIPFKIVTFFYLKIFKIKLIMEKKVEIYQFAPLSGMLMEGYLIKTPNDKIIIVDGGSGETYLKNAF